MLSLVLKGNTPKTQLEELSLTFVEVNRQGVSTAAKYHLKLVLPLSLFLFN